MDKEKSHILVVDDDDRIRDLIKQYLVDKKFIVSSAENAEKAKVKLKYFKFDIIILDVMMPGQNGFELTKEIRNKINTPIILLTAKHEVENRITGLELGADDYLGKPFEPKELLLRVNNIIKKNKKIKLKDTYQIGEAKLDLNKMSITLNNKISKINVSEKKLIHSLSISKIFLSFSNFEGMGMPPIEAAISGNKVIGYIGGGGSEYWKKPIFTKVENGEIEDFAKKIISSIKSYKTSWIKNTKKNRLLLSDYYSKKTEKESLILLSNKILNFFN